MVIPLFVPASVSWPGSAQTDARSRVAIGIREERRGRVGSADDTGHETRVV